MSAQCKVSVIVFVYNNEQYLKKCLDSLADQTMKDFEVICVDDGLADNSLAILEAYVKDDKRFKVIKQKNQYAGTVYNSCLKVAKGEYVVFSNSIAFFENEFLEKVYIAANEKTADIVLFDAKKYDKRTKTYKNASDCINHKFLPAKKVFSSKDVPENIMNICSLPLFTKIYRRDFVLSQDLCFQTFSNSNYIYFDLLSLCVAQKITVVDENLVYFQEKIKLLEQNNLNKEPGCCLLAYKAVYDELTKRGILQEFEKSWTNAAVFGVSNCLDNITSFDGKAALCKEICDPVFLNTGILSHSDDYYFNIRAKEKLAGSQYISSWCEHKNKVAQSKNTVCIKERTDKTEPLVSVIIPVYNVEDYLIDCLDSITQQTLSQIEIICINDGSTDNSFDVLMDYADKDERITVFNQNNGGLSYTRNVGIKNANGKYVYFMDSDDILDLDALKILYNRCEKLHLDVLYFDGSSFFDGDVSEQKRKAYETYYIRETACDDVYTGPHLLQKMFFNEEYRTSPCLQFLKRSHIEKQNLSFVEGIYHEDNIFNFLCMLSANKASHINKQLFKRRVRANSIMTSQTSFAHVYGYFRSFLDMTEYYQTLDLLENEQNAIGILFSRLMSNIRNKYLELSEAEKYSVLAMTKKEQILFKMYVTDFTDLLTRWRKDREGLKELSTIKNEAKKLNRKIKKQNRKIEKMKHSTYYKVGRVIMCVPIWIKKQIKKLIGSK